MSLTSYRAAPPRVGDGVCVGRMGGPGGDRLSRVLGRSIIGAGGFHGRVRDGIGCGLPAMATRSSDPACVVCGGSGVCGLLWVCRVVVVSRMMSMHGVDGAYWAIRTS